MCGVCWCSCHCDYPLARSDITRYCGLLRRRPNECPDEISFRCDFCDFRRFDFCCSICDRSQNGSPELIYYHLLVHNVLLSDSFDGVSCWVSYWRLQMESNHDDLVINCRLCWSWCPFLRGYVIKHCCEPERQVWLCDFDRLLGLLLRYYWRCFYFQRNLHFARTCWHLHCLWCHDLLGWQHHLPKYESEVSLISKCIYTAKTKLLLWGV